MSDEREGTSTGPHLHFEVLKKSVEEGRDED